jgi:hypothetical protein
MRPRTKLQLRVVGLSKALPGLTDTQEKWAFKNCLQHIGYRTKLKTHCLDCGHTWASKDSSLLLVKLLDTHVECPECGTKLKIEDTRRKNTAQRAFCATVKVVKEFQLTRFFEIRAFYKAGTKPSMHLREVAQHWNIPNGKTEVIAKNRNYTWSGDSFCGDLEIRERRSIRHKYNIWPDKVLPGARVLPVFKRNGFKGNFHQVAPYDMFANLLTDPKTETLLKTKQFELLRARHSDRGPSLNTYWDSVKICVRNNYIVKDAITWLDYLNLLRHFNKDLRSQRYVCPPNLKQVHDKLVAKKTELDRRQETERKRKRIEEDEAAYQKAKAAYFGLIFTDGLLTIKILESVREFMEEGDIHKHCVFTNNYYSKPDSLVFKASVDGKPVETVEVSLSTMKIIQSRGLHNATTEYNPRIVQLLTSNLQAIRKRQKAAKKQSTRTQLKQTA